MNQPNQGVHGCFGICHKDAHVDTKISGRKFTFLVDTDSQISVISKRILEKIKTKIKVDQISPGCQFLGAGGNMLRMIGTCLLNFSLGSQTFQHKFYIFEDAPMQDIDGILGSDFIKAHNLVVLISGQLMWFENNPNELVHFKTKHVSCISQCTSHLTTSIFAMEARKIPSFTEVVLLGESKGGLIYLKWG